ncbi:MAG TPA: hypothetical protein VHD63_24375, partial [Ktedonobacteraceae bacterium]|nr:hypothetical protein [Ktedonobacteraceae bacterium]
MTAEQLLQELETLTHAARIRRMVDVGRATIHDPQAAATVAILEQGEFYERFLALHACFGNHDEAHVLRALTDPSRIIRGVAIRLVPLACDEAQQRQALALVPSDGRRSFLWQLRHHGQSMIIDEFLEQLVATH